MKKDEKGSKLSPEVKSLINLIFDMKMMDSHLKEIGYDAKKMPLGKLKKETLNLGYQALTKLSDELNE